MLYHLCCWGALQTHTRSHTHHHPLLLCDSPSSEALALGNTGLLFLFLPLLLTPSLFLTFLIHFFFLFTEGDNVSEEPVSLYFSPPRSCRPCFCLWLVVIWAHSAHCLSFSSSSSRSLCSASLSAAPPPPPSSKTLLPFPSLTVHSISERQGRGGAEGSEG